MHWHEVEGSQVVFKTFFFARCEVEVVHAELACLREQRVVDVGHVAHALDRATRVDESPDEHVISEEGEGVPEMCGVVRRDTADVHLHLVSWREVDDFSAGGVVKTQGGTQLIPVKRGATRVL